MYTDDPDELANPQTDRLAIEGRQRSREDRYDNTSLTQLTEEAFMCNQN